MRHNAVSRDINLDINLHSTIIVGLNLSESTSADKLIEISDMFEYSIAHISNCTKKYNIIQTFCVKFSEVKQM